MANVLANASAWLADMRTKHAAETVEYECGGYRVSLAATLGRTMFEVDEGNGVLTQVESRDFLVKASDLVLDGQTVLPERGAKIRQTIGTVTHVYEVLAPKGQDVYKLADAHRNTLRIHTKHVDREF